MNISFNHSLHWNPVRSTSSTFSKKIQWFTYPKVGVLLALTNKTREVLLRNVRQLTKLKDKLKKHISGETEIIAGINGHSLCDTKILN